MFVVIEIMDNDVLGSPTVHATKESADEWFASVLKETVAGFDSWTSEQIEQVLQSGHYNYSDGSVYCVELTEKTLEI